jgi:hypothetical protein
MERADPPALPDESARPWRLEPKQRSTEMMKSARARAEELFTASQKRDRQALKEKEKAGQEIADRVAKLKALRLAKEAADKEKEDDG